MKIAFRPHHFLCAFCFQGKGYSPEFISNFSSIVDYLQSENSDTVIIEVVENTDSICDPCPHRCGQTCASQEKIRTLDQAHADILKLSPGDQISWAEAKKRIDHAMTLESFHRACSVCEWKKLGICETVLKNRPQCSR